MPETSTPYNLSNFNMLILASIGGIAIGGVVAGIRTGVGMLQTFLFGVDINRFGANSVDGWRIMLITLVGGLLLGSFLVLAARFHKLAIVDPVEANALEGGKMSFIDSLILVGLSVLSITIGGSVGFEAAMTQLGAGSLSAIGQRLNLNRRDLRILVSTGTGAGLAAIFGAPLAGTFYALELVIGGYAIRALMPTLLASALSSLVIFILIGNQPLFPVTSTGFPTFWHFPLALMIGFCAALIGIVVMRGTTSFDNLLKIAHVPPLLKPAIGGAILGGIALLTPQIMGPSHAGINEILTGHELLGITLILLLAKIAASIACVGSGFRGGLFSASLFLGASLGCLLHGIIIMPLFGEMIPLDLCVVAGMAGVATAIIGTPIGIVLLMIEIAGLHTGVVTTVITVIIASHFTKQWFGFSFSTWRFHVRGSDLGGPQDIGRLRDLKFSDLTLIHPPAVAQSSSLENAAQLAVALKTPLLAVENNDGDFLGLLHRHELLEELTQRNQRPISELIDKPTLHANKDESITHYLESVDDHTTGEIVVFASAGKLYGLASEATILRRYLKEIQAATDDEIGL